MKKISLKSVKETLTRKEMRMIAGGYGYSGYGNCCAVIMEPGHPWSDCGLTMQEAQDAVCRYGWVYQGYLKPYQDSYWTCTN